MNIDTDPPMQHLAVHTAPREGPDSGKSQVFANWSFSIPSAGTSPADSFMSNSSKFRRKSSCFSISSICAATPLTPASSEISDCSISPLATRPNLPLLKRSSLFDNLSSRPLLSVPEQSVSQREEGGKFVGVQRRGSSSDRYQVYQTSRKPSLPSLFKAVSVNETHVPHARPPSAGTPVAHQQQQQQQYHMQKHTLTDIREEAQVGELAVKPAKSSEDWKGILPPVHDEDKNDPRGIYRCPVPNCGKYFTRRFNLRCHLRTHAGARPYACQLCDAEFSRKHDLRRHVKSIHSDTKPHNCKYCPSGFTRMDGLKRHLITESANLSTTHPRWEDIMYQPMFSS
ncbi:MAG: hypothetical protein SGCHY_004594 [Lobulomycetales sp.]